MATVFIRISARRRSWSAGLRSVEPMLPIGVDPAVGGSGGGAAGPSPARTRAWLMRSILPGGA